MSTRTPRPTRTLLAISAAYLALLVGSLLSAAPVSAQVPPPEAVPPARHVSNLGGTTSAGWPTYVLVACVAIAIGVALGYGLTHMRSHHQPARATTNNLDQQPLT